MDPKLKATLTHLAAVVLGALAAYFGGTGCTPAQIGRVESAADKAQVQALCAKTALEAHDALLVHPDLESVAQGVALAKDLEACFRKAPPAADMTDAGAR